MMGMTLWIHTLEDRNYLRDSADHSLMNWHLDYLDALCTEAQVQKLSEYIDYTDQQFNYNDFDDDNESELDLETGLAYGINDMTWFNAADGLVSLQAVRARVAVNGLVGVDAGTFEKFLEELDDCISVIHGSASRGGKFHLSLVE
jgi:hypothetical protein